jgi:hypothetical protein
MASSMAEDIGSIANIAQKKLASPLSKPCYLVAPMYSTSTTLEPGTFGPILVARIRALKYLHFFCLPDERYLDRPGSIIRLDRIFPTYLGRGCNSKSQRINKEPFEVLLSQFSILTGGVDSKPYKLVKELVQDALPLRELKSCNGCY